MRTTGPPTIWTVAALIRERLTSCEDAIYALQRGTNRELLATIKAKRDELRALLAEIERLGDE